MDLEDFTFGIKRIQRRYNHKLTQDQETIYFERISDIPQEIFMRAVDDIIDSSRFFPAPGEFKTYWYQWQITHPERIDREKSYCAECHGEGVLYFKVKPKGATFDREYEYIARCGSCENWKGDVGKWLTRMTIQELRYKGLDVISKVTWDESQKTDRDINSKVPF